MPLSNKQRNRGNQDPHPLDEVLKRASELEEKGQIPDAIRELYKCLDYSAAPDLEGGDDQHERLAEAPEAASGGKGSSAPEPLETFKCQEKAVYAIARMYVSTNQADKVRSFLQDILPRFQDLPKAKTAKIVRNLIEEVTKVLESMSSSMAPIKMGDKMSLEETEISPAFALGIALCQDCIAWCRKAGRTFLRLRVEKQLLQLYYQSHCYQQGLQALPQLTREAKKLDDKLLLVEIYLLESKIYSMLANQAKSKASLTASRTNANAIHCPPLLQAEIDLQAGVLYSDEQDFKTAFSYFYEAFEAFHLANEEAKATMALQYQLLAKIMIAGQRNAAAKVSSRKNTGGKERISGGGGGGVFGGDDLTSLSSVLSGKKNGLKYLAYEKTKAVLAVAKCHQTKSLEQFDAVLTQYRTVLESDAFLWRHIQQFNSTVLEENLLKLVEPFSRVEVEHIAKLINLPAPKVLAKLCEMVLDKKLDGTVNQKEAILICFEAPPVSSAYQDALDTIANVSKCVDSLYEKTTKLLSH